MKTFDALQQEAIDQINSGQSEVILDFSSVHRIDSNGAGAMERLAGVAQERNARVVLRAVNMDIYKVLKLLKLTQHFSFLT